MFLEGHEIWRNLHRRFVFVVPVKEGCNRGMACHLPSRLTCPLLQPSLLPVKSTMEISQNFVAFSEHIYEH
jgi:hypothetical protein